MTFQELKFLKLLHELTHRTEQVFIYDNFDCSVHLYSEFNVCLPCGKLSCEINSIINSLLDGGYISSYPTNGIDERCYRLTHKGLHPFQFSFAKFLSFLIRSIIVPIIVAFVTALWVSA